MMLFTLAVVPALISLATAHNYAYCINSKPNLTALLTETTGVYSSRSDICDGWPRGMPSSNLPYAGDVGDQGFPWQFIWPMQDGASFKTHRACNWNQELPVYDPDKNVTKVKPGATILIQISTNAHTHEYLKRPSGHYKIYLAGDSGTHITVSSQLTDDRVVFKAPANKYAHIIGDTSKQNFNGDPGYSWLPFKLVDPTGKPLPPGVYNFVWTWWWASGDETKGFKDYMVPAYSTCFDIVVDEAATDAGFLTAFLKNDPNAHKTLIGNTTSPGAKDTTPPWPPYPEGYLTTNYDGTDPSTPEAKRSFQPFFKTPIASTKMPAPISRRVLPIAAWTKPQLLQQIVSPSGTDPETEFPANLTASGSISAGSGTDQIPVTEKLRPLNVPSQAQGEAKIEPKDTVFYTNTTDPVLEPGSGNYTMEVVTYLGVTQTMTGVAGATGMPGGAFYASSASGGAKGTPLPGVKGGYYKGRRLMV